MESLHKYFEMKIYVGYFIIILIFIIGCAQQLTESSVCENEQNKDECFVKLVVDRLDYTLCKRIGDKMLRHNCYGYVADHTGDTKICEEQEENANISRIQFNIERCNGRARAYLPIQRLLDKQCKALDDKNIDDLISTFDVENMNIELIREQWLNIFDKVEIECGYLKIDTLDYNVDEPKGALVHLESDLTIEYDGQVIKFERGSARHLQRFTVFSNEDNTWRDSQAIGLLSFTIEEEFGIQSKLWSEMKARSKRNI